jgi:hypothetical protein
MSDDDMVTIHSSIIPVRDVLEAFSNPAPPDFSGDPAELLTPEAVAAWMKIKVETLATWRSKGRGPRACYVEGAVRYRRGTVANFIRKSEHANAVTAATIRDACGTQSKRVENAPSAAGGREEK